MIAKYWMNWCSTGSCVLCFPMSLLINKRTFLSFTIIAVNASHAKIYRRMRSAFYLIIHVLTLPYLHFGQFIQKIKTLWILSGLAVPKKYPSPNTMCSESCYPTHAQTHRQWETVDVHLNVHGVIVRRLWLVYVIHSEWRFPAHYLTGQMLAQCGINRRCTIIARIKRYVRGCNPEHNIISRHFYVVSFKWPFVCQIVDS